MKKTISWKMKPIDINLLQYSQVTEIKPVNNKAPLLIVILAAILGALVLAWIWYDAKTRIEDYNQQIAAIDVQIKRLQEGTPSSKVTVNDLLALPGKLSKNRTEISSVIEQLDKLMPQNANVVAVSFSDGKAVKVTSNFATSEGLIQFIQSVTNSKNFVYEGMSAITKVAANAEKQAPNESFLPVIQVTFDLTYNTAAAQKG